MIFHIITGEVRLVEPVSNSGQEEVIVQPMNGWLFVVNEGTAESLTATFQKFHPCENI